MSYVRALRIVAIPQSGLLAQVSSLCPREQNRALRPDSQRSTAACASPARLLKSTAGCASCSSLPSPHLLLADAGVCAAFPLGELLLGS